MSPKDSLENSKIKFFPGKHQSLGKGTLGNLDSLKNSGIVKVGKSEYNSDHLSNNFEVRDDFEGVKKSTFA